MDYLQYLLVMDLKLLLVLVLNLIINGLPSILLYLLYIQLGYLGFKPYYKWITFNTIKNNIRDRIALAEF